MRKSANNTIQFQESEWVDPRAYQRAFLEAVRSDTPEVLETLRDELLPRYSTPAMFAAATPRLKSRTPTGAAPVSAGEMEDFRARLDKWTTRFNLMDPWLREVAVLTLDRWKNYPKDLAALTWAPVPFGPTPLSLDREFKFRDSGWSVESEKWSEFSERVTRLFKRRLDEYKEDVEGQVGFGLPALPEIRQAKHYTWLALYQVRGLSAAQIADALSTNKQTLIENTVLKAVPKSAELVGLTLRKPRKGEGRKLHRKAPRHRRAGRTT